MQATPAGAVATSRADDGAGSRIGAIAAVLRGAPPEALLVGLGLFVLLAAFVSADPATGLSFSVGPQGDEAYNIISGRNLVLLGQWATDSWDHHFVNLPFSLMSVGLFKVFGVGIVQARLATILCVSLAATGLIWGLRGVVGRPAALFAGLAFATSGLVLYYGRLAFLEDLVVLAVTLGTLVLARQSRVSIRGGVLAGLCFAVAVGTKPNSAFEVFGILAALAVVWGWRDRAMQRWLLGAAGTIAVAGLVWGLVIFLPNREAVITDIKIWEPSTFYVTPSALIHSLGSYLGGNNDHLYGMLLGPLIAMSAAGIVCMVALRRMLGRAETRLAVAAFGWALFGFGILVVTSYRPNRYVVPIVPALAILACIGLRVAMQWLRERGGREAAESATGSAAGEAEAAPATAPTLPRSRRFAAPIVAVLAIALAVAPGLVWYASWAPNATYNIVNIESQMKTAAPAGETVAGNHTALYMLTSSNRLIVTGIANNGDLYVTGVRWYLAQVDAAPPVGVPAGVWAARTSVSCVEVPGWKECLFQVK